MSTALVTLADVKAYGSITTPNADGVLQDLIAAAAPALAAYCNRSSFFSQTFVRRRNGNATAMMMLADKPLTDVTRVVVDGRSIPRAEGSGTGYDFEEGGRAVYLRGHIFTTGFFNVEIEYRAGYNDPDGKYPLPDDLALAAKIWIMARFRERDRIGIGSKSLAGESVTFSDGSTGAATGGIPTPAVGILNKYMNVVPV